MLSYKDEKHAISLAIVIYLVTPSKTNRRKDQCREHTRRKRNFS